MIYTDITLVGMILFGERVWLSRAECFSVFLRLRRAAVAAAAVRRDQLALAFPGATLAAADPLPLSGVLFVLLTSATVSFDGLDRTFWWLDLGGINPLDFPGRSAVTGQNSLGLLAMWGALSGAYALGDPVGPAPGSGSGVDAGTASALSSCRSCRSPSAITSPIT